VRPLKQIPRHNITEPPPNGTLREILQLANLPPAPRQAGLRPSEDLRLTLVSSEFKTKYKNNFIYDRVKSSHFLH
jgi:hypothetical protein